MNVSFRLNNDHMRKFVLFLLVAGLIVSCDKTIKQPLNYSVTNDALATGVYDVYLPDSGAYTMPALVKFLSGYPSDSVKLVLTGLPAGITVTPDTFTAIPTYTANFVFNTNHTAHSTYPVTITAYTPTQNPMTFNFNLIVVPADAASLFWGNLSDSSACTARDYKYTATGVASGTKNTLIINNFGGYGTEVNVTVLFDEQNGTLTIPSQVCGNGSQLSGSGTFTENKMIINYSASSTPTNPAETCTAIFTN